MGLGMITNNRVPTANIRVAISMSMMPLIPIKGSKAPAVTGAIMPEAEYTIPIIALARV